MKLVQKILSHGLFIAFIVGAVLVYTKRAELFPQWFGASQPVAAKASSGKLADATPDNGVPATERKVSRPLPEKTLMKEPVAPPVPAPEEAAPSETAPEGEAPAPGQQTSTPGTTSSSPERESAGQPAPEQAGDTGVSEKKPVFRPLEKHEQQAAAGAAESEPAAPPEAAPDQNAGGGADAQPVFRPLDGGQPSKTAATGVQEAPAVEAPAPEAGAPATAEATPNGQSEVANAAPQPAEEKVAVAAPAEEKVAVAAPAEVARAAVPKPAAADDTAAAQAASGAPAGGEDARLQQMLEQARGLFWRRDLRGAAAAYTAVSDAYPDNAEVWGEIGNFYFSLHQAEPAGEAYAHAIELLAQNDEPMRARRLLDVLFRLDPQKARELESRLRVQTGG